jgi:hypothetical protein
VSAPRLRERWFRTSPLPDGAAGRRRWRGQSDGAIVETCVAADLAPCTASAASATPTGSCSSAPCSAPTRSPARRGPGLCAPAARSCARRGRYTAAAVCGDVIRPPHERTPPVQHRRALAPGDAVGSGLAGASSYRTFLGAINLIRTANLCEMMKYPRSGRSSPARPPCWAPRQARASGSPPARPRRLSARHRLAVEYDRRGQEPGSQMAGGFPLPRSTSPWREPGLARQRVGCPDRARGPD